MGKNKAAPSALVQILTGAGIALAADLVLLAISAYLVFRSLVEEGRSDMLLYLSAFAASAIAIAVGKIKTLADCFGVVMSVWGVLMLAGFLMNDGCEIRSALLLLLSLFLGAGGMLVAKSTAKKKLKSQKRRRRAK